MKKLLLIVSITTFLMSCNKLSKNEYLVHGTAEGIPDGKMIFIEKDDETGLKIIDSAKIEKGKFKFNKSQIQEPEIHFIQVEGINKGKTPFILEAGDIKITIYKDSLESNNISGTYNNDQLNEYSAVSKQIQKKILDFQNTNQAKMNEAQQTGNHEVINQLMKEFAILQQEAQDKSISYSKNYIENHPKSFITVLLIQSLFNQQNADVEKIKTYYNNLDPILKDTKAGKNITEGLKKLEEREKATAAVAIGQIAPDFSAPNPEGKEISLKKSLGKVTIIDFWASWCKPCREENPNIVALYKEFHSKGLNIIGVSLDRPNGAEAWKKAIEDDHLTWTQVSTLSTPDPIALQYNVTSIPHTIILDSTGKIVAKNLRGDELKDKVKELLSL